MHPRLCVTQVKTRILGERLDSGFAGVVGWVSGWIGDALLAAGNDEGGRRGLGLEVWHKGVEAANDAVEICVEDLRDDV